jgi:hypothetical protein
LFQFRKEVIDAFGVGDVKFNDRDLSFSSILHDLLFGLVGLINVSTGHDDIHDWALDEMLNDTIANSLVASSNNNGSFFVFHHKFVDRKRYYFLEQKLFVINRVV